jgi:excinuclease UvrABC nuclease subunit
VGGLRRIELEEYEPGIYFLCLLGEVVYVGQTSRPKMRISDHIQEKKKIFDRAFIRHCRLEELNALESFFIHALEPKYNCTLPNGQKLAPQTMQDIAETARWLVGRDIKKRVHIEALK